MRQVAGTSVYPNNPDRDGIGHSGFDNEIVHPVMDWFSKKRREQKRKQAEEAALKASLSAKISRYEASLGEKSEDIPVDDHTELMLDGKKVRVAKKEITLTDV